MSTKTFCDQCGKDSAWRVGAYITTSNGKASGELPELNCDLCKDCFDRLVALLRAAFPRHKGG